MDSFSSIQQDQVRKWLTGYSRYHERTPWTHETPEHGPITKESRDPRRRSATLGFVGLGLANVPAFAYLQGLKFARTLQAPDKWAAWSSETFLRRRLAWVVKATGATDTAVKVTSDLLQASDRAEWASVLSFSVDSLPPLNQFWTTIAVNFVHFDLKHFLSNMGALYVAATTCVDIPGMTAWHISAVTLASGIMATASMLIQFRLVKTGLAILATRRTGIGASGVVSAFMAVAAIADPTKRVDIIPFLPGVVTMPNWFVAGSSFLGDIYGLLVALNVLRAPASFPTNIGHAAHLGGTAVGVLYYLFVLRPLPARTSVGVQTSAEDETGDQEGSMVLLQMTTTQ